MLDDDPMTPLVADSSPPDDSAEPVDGEGPPEDVAGTDADVDDDDDPSVPAEVGSTALPHAPANPNPATSVSARPTPEHFDQAQQVITGRS